MERIARSEIASCDTCKFESCEIWKWSSPCFDCDAKVWSEWQPKNILLNRYIIEDDLENRKE